MINIILLTIIIGLFIGSSIFLLTNYVCIPKCNKCGVPDTCGGTCSCKKGKTCDANNVCNDDIKESLSIPVLLDTQQNCTGESEQIIKEDGSCLPCCPFMFPYTDGACHKWPHQATNVDIDRNPPSCVSKPPIGCTSDGKDMFETGMCLPCCAKTNSYLLTTNSCTNDAEYKYYCYSPEKIDKYMTRNLYRSDPKLCMPYIGVPTSSPPPPPSSGGGIGTGEKMNCTIS